MDGHFSKEKAARLARCLAVNQSFICNNQQLGKQCGQKRQDSRKAGEQIINVVDIFTPQTPQTNRT